LKEDGTMIVSGVSDQWHEEVAALFVGSGLVTEDHARRDGWNCYILTRGREASFNP
jgi:ribosomal protein L11 methylase PrmA